MSFDMHMLARRHGRSLQELMAKAFNDVLRKHGESPSESRSRLGVLDCSQDRAAIRGLLESLPRSTCLLGRDEAHFEGDLL